MGTLNETVHCMIVDEEKSINSILKAGSSTRSEHQQGVGQHLEAVVLESIHAE
jgi:hypothetical protein